MVGYDATSHSDAALDWAVRYATTHRRPLLLVFAAGLPTVYDTFTGPDENRKELGSWAVVSSTRASSVLASSHLTCPWTPIWRLATRTTCCSTPPRERICSSWGRAAAGPSARCCSGR